MGKRLGSPRIALFGSGAQAQDWACALAAHASLVSGSLEGADGVVLAPGTADPAATASEAARGGLPVLWACGRASELESPPIEGLSAAQQALLRVHEGALYGYGEALCLMNRLMGAPEPFWQPLYLEMRASSDAGIEEGAIGALASVDRLLGVQAEQVAAQAAGQKGEETAAVFVSVRYRGGPLLQLTVTHDTAADELTVVTQERRLHLAGQRLVISRTSGSGRGRVIPIAVSNPIPEGARAFAEGVGLGSLSGSLEKWLRAIALWEGAQESLRQGRPVWFSPASAETKRPVSLAVSAHAARRAQSRRPAVVA